MGGALEFGFEDESVADPGEAANQFVDTGAVDAAVVEHSVSVWGVGGHEIPVKCDGVATQDGTLGGEMLCQVISDGQISFFKGYAASRSDVGK